MVAILNENENAILQDLVQEILDGKHIKDTLGNASYDFSGKTQALYFSNTRKNVKSDMGFLVINGFQSLDDLKIMKMIEGKKSNE